MPPFIFLFHRDQKLSGSFILRLPQILQTFSRQALFERRHRCSRNRHPTCLIRVVKDMRVFAFKNNPAHRVHEERERDGLPNREVTGRWVNYLYKKRPCGFKPIRPLSPSAIIFRAIHSLCEAIEKCGIFARSNSEYSFLQSNLMRLARCSLGEDEYCCNDDNK